MALRAARDARLWELQLLMLLVKRNQLLAEAIGDLSEKEKAKTEARAAALRVKGVSASGIPSAAFSPRGIFLDSIPSVQGEPREKESMSGLSPGSFEQFSNPNFSGEGDDT